MRDTGNVADVRRRSGARVVAHAADAPVITGAIRPAPQGFLVKVVSRLMGTAEPTKLDQLITADGSEPVPGFTALHTPGHTPAATSPTCWTGPAGSCSRATRRPASRARSAARRGPRRPTWPSSTAASASWRHAI